jgi:hypothetical protein
MELVEDSKKKDLRRVVEHPKTLSKRLLEKSDSQEGI